MEKDQSCQKAQQEDTLCHHCGRLTWGGICTGYCAQSAIILLHSLRKSRTISNKVGDQTVWKKWKANDGRAVWRVKPENEFSKKSK